MTADRDTGRWDDVLENEPPVEPRADFCERVMHSVHASVVEPSPLRVPWRSALAGAAALALCVIATVVVIVVGLDEKTLASLSETRVVMVCRALVAAIVCALTILGALALPGNRSDDGVDSLSL